MQEVDAELCEAVVPMTQRELPDTAVLPLWQVEADRPLGLQNELVSYGLPPDPQAVLTPHPSAQV